MLSLKAVLSGIPVPGELPTIKLYLEKEGSIHYWQAYGSSKEPLSLVIHWGRLGETGEFVETLDKSLDEMMDTAWKWELKLKQDEQFFSSIKSELN